MAASYCDLHTHSIYSRHAYSTVHENLLAARAVGCPLVGLTDHFSPMIYGPVDGSYKMQDFQYLVSLASLPRRWEDTYLLRGAEVDIVSLEGALFGQNIYFDHDFFGNPIDEPIELFEWVTRDLDYLIASVHATSFAKGASRLEQTNAYIGALEQEKVFILGHIGRSGLDIEVDPILKAAKDLGKCIELNESTFSMSPKEAHDRCRHIAERAAELGCNVSCGSDAHVSYYIGEFSQVQALLDEVHMPSEQIVCSSAKSAVCALEAALGTNLALDL